MGAWNQLSRLAGSSYNHCEDVFTFNFLSNEILHNLHVMARQRKGILE